jgi:hypothetical protein
VSIEIETKHPLPVSRERVMDTNRTPKKLTV